MMSRLVITFLPRSKHLLILWLQSVTICSDFGVPKIKSATVSTVSPSICHEVMGPDAMILVFWMLSFKSTFWLSSFTFIKRLFSSSSLSVRRMVLFAYLRLLIFLPAILIPAFASSSPVFLMMYSAYKLNKQGDNIQPWSTPSPIWNQSVNDSHLEFTLLCAALPLWIRAGSGWPIDSGESQVHDFQRSSHRRDCSLHLDVLYPSPWGNWTVIPWGMHTAHEYIMNGEKLRSSPTTRTYLATMWLRHLESISSPSQALRWLKPQLTSDCKCMRDPK